MKGLIALDFVVGDYVYAINFKNRIARVKAISGTKCTLEFPEPVMGSKVKISDTSRLKLMSNEEMCEAAQMFAE